MRSLEDAMPCTYCWEVCRCSDCLSGCLSAVPVAYLPARSRRPASRAGAADRRTAVPVLVSIRAAAV